MPLPARALMVKAEIMARFEEVEKEKGKITEADIFNLIKSRKPDVTIEVIQKALPKFQGKDKQVSKDEFERGLVSLVPIIVLHVMVARFMELSAGGVKITEAQVMQLVQQRFNADATVAEVQKAFPKFKGDDTVITLDHFKALAHKMIEVRAQMA